HALFQHHRRAPRDVRGLGEDGGRDDAAVDDVDRLTLVGAHGPSSIGPSTAARESPRSVRVDSEQRVLMLALGAGVAGRVANCPNCGGAVTFKADTSLLAVCPYCSSAVARTGGDVGQLEVLGKVAPLADLASPLSLGV